MDGTRCISRISNLCQLKIVFQVGYNMFMDLLREKCKGQRISHELNGSKCQSEQLFQEVSLIPVVTPQQNHFEYKQLFPFKPQIILYRRQKLNKSHKNKFNESKPQKLTKYTNNTFTNRTFKNLWECPKTFFRETTLPF